MGTERVNLLQVAIAVRLVLVCLLLGVPGKKTVLIL